MSKSGAPGPRRGPVRIPPSARASARLALVALLTCATARAEPPPIDDPDPSEEPTVTAPRVEKLLSEYPGAVSVVGGRAIELAEPQVELGESLDRVPGVFVQNRANFAQDARIAIRGFGARSGFGIRGIRVVVDGIPATLPDGQTQVDHIDLGSAERIEVLRGPSSSLYGPSSGGVILVQSLGPSAEPASDARVAFGSHGYRRYQTRASGSAGPAGYMLSVSRLELDGYRDHSRTENVLFNSNFRFDIDSTSSLGLVANVLHAPISDDPGALTADEVTVDRRQAAPNNRLFDAGESIDQQQFGLHYRKAFGEHHEIEANNYYVWRKLENRLPFESGGSVDLERFFTGGGLRYLYTDRFFDRDNRLLFGVEADVQRDVRKRFDNELGSRGARVFDQDENVTGFGVYLQDELRLREDLELSAGVRYDRVAFHVEDGFPADGNDGGEIHFDHVSPRVGLVWRALPEVHLFADVSTGFETPTTTELANPDGSGGFDRDLEAQTSVGYEAGVKGGRSGRFFYELVGFYIDVDHELVPYEVPGMPGRNFFENAGSSKRAGLELFVRVEPVAGLQASLAYTYSHFEFTRFRAGAGSFDGNAIPGIPRNRVWAEISYTHPSGLYGRWDVVYTDGFYADNANAVEGDDAVVSNLRAGYQGRIGGLQIGPFVGVDNVFGKKFDDNLRLNAAFGRTFEPAPERVVYGGLSLSYRFGGP